MISSGGGCHFAVMLTVSQNHVGDSKTMTRNDNLPSCDDILQMPPTAVPQLVLDLSRRRQLSLLIKRLNGKLAQGEAAAQEQARAVLARLGFLAD
jgi:hypothetical protein